VKPKSKADEARDVAPKKKKRKVEPVRYSVRAERAGRIVEVGVSADKSKRIRLASRHHSEHKLKTWVWNLRTGETVHRINAGEL